MRFVCAYLAAPPSAPRGSLVRDASTSADRSARRGATQPRCEDHLLTIEGYPPLLIEPSTFAWQGCELDASSSSQYLSALLLLAPTLPTGFEVDTRCYGLASRPLCADDHSPAPRARLHLGGSSQRSLLLSGGRWKRIAAVHRLLIKVTKQTGVQHPMLMHSSASCP